MIESRIQEHGLAWKREGPHQKTWMTESLGRVSSISSMLGKGIKGLMVGVVKLKLLPDLCIVGVIPR